MENEIKYIIPEKLHTNDGHIELSNERINHWKTRGYLVIDGLLSDDLISRCIDEVTDVLKSSKTDDFGSDGKLEFPTGLKACDDITLHHNFIKVCCQLLDVDEKNIRLIQSDIWPKIGNINTYHDKYANADQRIHCDYGNNTLVHPPSWDKPECVSMIVYLSDEDDTSGGTAIVPREDDDDELYSWPLIAMPGYGGLPFINNKYYAEEYMKENHPQFYEMRQKLYARECRVKFKPGTVLIYRHDIWHRGTPVNSGKLRIVCNLGYKRSDAEWVTTWNAGWAKNMYYGKVEKMIADASPISRSLLGFPIPGHSYWNEITIRAVTARYKSYGFDPSPYLDELKKKINDNN